MEEEWRKNEKSMKDNIKTRNQTTNNIKKFIVSTTSVGNFDKNQISEFIEWLKSIKFNKLVIKSENNTLRISLDNCDVLESILKALPFESYAFMITEIIDEV